MLTTQQVAGIAAGVISFIGYAVYIFAIFKSGTKPNRAAWLIWVIAGVILAASYYQSGARGTMWVPVIYVAGPLVVAVLSIWWGEGGFNNRFDIFCLAACAVSGVLWWVFASPTIALIINLMIDALGLLPIIKKSWLRPQGESKPAWALFFMGNIINLLAVATWSIAEWRIIIYPVYMFCATGTVMLLLLRKPKVG